ncbi:MAG: hypothetical protein ACRDDW_07605 [Candidatus Rhabdochlamydia sp.]
MSIILLKEPNCPYIVHFNACKDNQEISLNTVKKTQECVQRSFQLLGVFFVALKDSVYKNIGNAGTSFKYIVLGYYGSLSDFRPPKDIYLAVFKIVFWVAAMGWGTIATTFRLFMERTSPGHSLLLKQFVNDEINVDHIKTEELELDTSFVPLNIKVDVLKDLFKEINFTNKNAPGYMAPETRREITRIFSPEELEGNLEKFIQRVNTREAFLGTPPGHDVPRLMDFYQQIEDAVRLSIYQTTKDVAEFETQNGTDFANFSIEKNREYNNLLEIRARVVLDLAIAGAHCGARYMGEAMDVYYSVYGKEGITNDKDFQGTIIEILAKKREEIAKGQIQIHLGTDTHQFTKYMSNMGKVLGIPGTKNIIEHLSRSIDIYQMLNYFFQEYTVDTIIDTIQEKIKTSKTFREKITDWIKDQVEDWNRKKYENVDNIVKRIEEFLGSNLETPASAHNFKIIQEVLFDLKKEKVALPKINGDWDDFLIEFFTLPELKDKLKNMLPQGKEESDLQYRMRFAQQINTLKRSCSEAMLGSELLKELQDAIESDNFIPIPLDRYLPRFMEKTKIEKMKAILANEYEIPIEQDTLSRVLKGEVNLTTAIQNYQEQARQNEFLTCFDLEEIAEKGISKELMEWILVSQGILNPQITIQSEIGHRNFTLNQVQSYVNVVYQGLNIEITNQISLEKLFELLNSRNENREEISSYISTLALSEKRYRQDASFEREKILTRIFNQSFCNAPDEVIPVAEKITNKIFYPKWKKVGLIQLPKASAALFSNVVFKIALTVSTIAISAFLIYQTHAEVKHFIAARGIPFVINHVPVQIIRAGNKIIEAKEFVWRHSLKIIMATWLFREGIGRLPEIPYLSAAARTIDLWKVYKILFSSPQTLFGFAISTSLNAISSVWNTSQEISHQFRRISNHAEKERLMLCKQKSLEVWEGCQRAALA